MIAALSGHASPLNLQVFLGHLDQLQLAFQRLSHLRCGLVIVVQTDITEGITHLRVRHEAGSSRDAHRLTDRVHLFGPLLDGLESLPAAVGRREGQLGFVVWQLTCGSPLHETDVLPPHSVPRTILSTIDCVGRGGVLAIVILQGQGLQLLGLGIGVVHVLRRRLGDLLRESVGLMRCECARIVAFGLHGKD